MSRKLRETAQGLTYHCFTKYHGGQNIVKIGRGRKLFLETVQMCRAKYEFELISAEVLSNQIHLIIRTVPGGKNISFIMQYIKSRIAEKYNRSMGTTGVFWNERFKSTVIENTIDPEQYLNRLLWNISIETNKKYGTRRSV